MAAIPAIGSPGEFGANVTIIPVPEMIYLSGPVEMMMPPAFGHGPD
jgi:hypothetical protein